MTRKTMISLANTSATASNSRWLWLVLLITVALTMWTALSPQTDEADTIALAEPRNPNAIETIRPRQNTQQISTSNDAAPAANWLQQLKREAPQARYDNLFAVHSWVVAAPIIKTNAKPLPPPKPTAPPAPFTYMGKLDDGPNGSKVFLMANNRVYSVSTGDNVDPFWRLDGEDENSLQLTFLPLNLPQVLSKSKPLASPTNIENSALENR